jgi:hypothetical protein
MLGFGSLHRKLAIVVSPSGDFYTPTSPKDYDEGQAIAECMMGSRKCFFQRLAVQEMYFPDFHSFIPLPRFRHADQWIVQMGVIETEDFPEGWRILEARSYCVPNALTPKQAASVLKAHDSSKFDAGPHHYARDCPCERGEKSG